MKPKYHAGELAVQERAGVKETAKRVAGAIRPTLPPVAQGFLSNQQIIVLSSVDDNGHVWASILTGKPGFIEVPNENTLKILAEPISGDPLAENLQAGAEVGVLSIEFETRRRMKVKGRVESLFEGGFYISVERVYALCPKYIQARHITNDGNEPHKSADVDQRSALTDKQRKWIESTDTFFIASFNPETGADASHRGGNPGFVQVLDANRLVFPDYSGNTMFNTLGNLQANPNSGLIFIDFEKGATLQITGKAKIVWDNEALNDFPGAERLVEFEIEQVIEIAGAIPHKWRFLGYSPFNPA